jgi:hypothetical protein
MPTVKLIALMDGHQVQQVLSHLDMAVVLRHRIDTAPVRPLDSRL